MYSFTVLSYSACQAEVEVPPCRGNSFQYWNVHVLLEEQRSGERQNQGNNLYNGLLDFPFLFSSKPLQLVAMSVIWVSLARWPCLSDKEMCSFVSLSWRSHLSCPTACSSSWSFFISLTSKFGISFCKICSGPTLKYELVFSGLQNNDTFFLSLSVCFTTQSVEVLGSLGFKWLLNPLYLEFQLFIIKKEASWICWWCHTLAVPFQIWTTWHVSPMHSILDLPKSWLPEVRTAPGRYLV